MVKVLDVACVYGWRPLTGDLSNCPFSVIPAHVHGLHFAFCAVIDGVEYKTGIGKSKKEARLQAAQYALEDLLPAIEQMKSTLPETPG